MNDYERMVQHYREQQMEEFLEKYPVFGPILLFVLGVVWFLTVLTIVVLILSLIVGSVLVLLQWAGISFLASR